MSELPVINALEKYIKEKNALFCTPGHKGGEGFKGPWLKEFNKDVFKFDLTEVDGLDNLHNPEGAIKDSLELLSKFYGSHKSYYLVNGSTLGNLVMIFSCFDEGDKILIERNCHKSVYNAVIMKKLKPIFIQNPLCETLNTSLPIDIDEFNKIINFESDIKGIVITYPNYYGLCCDLGFIIKECHKRNIKVLVDSAHGAHFGVSKTLPESAVKLGADMVVSSAHKTLPSFTQSAWLHISKNVDISKVDFYYKGLSSTSPSYLFLCSLEYSRYYLEVWGKDHYEELAWVSDYYREKINTIDHIKIIGKDHLKNDELKKYIYDMDITRYIINLEKGYSGHLLMKYLRTKGIQCEFSDDSNVVLILSPFNRREEFEKLYFALKNCKIKILKSNNYGIIKYSIPKLELDPYKAVNSNKKSICYDLAEGELCAEEVTPYPPGVPLLLPGEKISGEQIKVIENCVRQGIDIIGLDKDKLFVIDKSMEEL